MSVNIDRVSILVGFIDRIISLRDISNTLSDEVVDSLIKEAIDFSGATFTAEEIEVAKNDINWKYLIYSTPGQSIVQDYEMDNWYDDRKSSITPTFWTRYKDYLIDKQNFSPNVVTTLGDETLDQKLMNFILDPKADYPEPVLRRGLIIGDVQSGKTSTYIGFMCKAADAGYKVFILLTGTIESLRKQTQERVEEGFIGIDMSADKTGGKRVGVGLDMKPIRAMAITSRVADFTGNADKIAVSLSANNDAVVFVIKKNKSSLENLTNWLLTLNADPITKKIDMPMLMIDDEADNASINTSKSKEDPTTINRNIRKLASIFTKSNYVGFTATPFANVFIDPETTESMENHDLFPENFIVALPTPSNYIGPNQIYPIGSEHYSQLVYIKDAGREEEDGYDFYFKHKKEWEGKLPESLTDAVYTFYLANAIRDLRGDVTAHRSMLVNISRFVKVQKYIKGQIEEIHSRAYRSIKYNLSKNFDESMSDPVLERIYNCWEQHYNNLEFTWGEITSVLFKAIEKIQIKVVNSSKGSEKLAYPKTDSVRVIAIGGLALSRGLTLEGLVISYFYRNTCTYDVLMQMGRWFGYRRNYEDVFRIWTHRDSAEWYAEIAKATEELKRDMSIMREMERTPRDFGIRVRNDSSELRITAYNKMRNSNDEYEYTSYYGDIVETPYLHYTPQVHIDNFDVVKSIVHELVEEGFLFERQSSGNGRNRGRYIIQNIPKIRIIELIRRITISRYSSSFDTKQIAEFLESTSDPTIAKFDIAFIEGSGNSISENNTITLEGRRIRKIIRGNSKVTRNEDRLSIGRKGKLGGTDDGRAGIVDFNNKSAEDIIEKARADYRAAYKREHGSDFTANKTYPSNLWFRYVCDRRPIILVYFVDVTEGTADNNQKKQFDELKAALGSTPVVCFAMGIPWNSDASDNAKTRYRANSVYNWFERDQVLAESDEE